MTDILTKLTVWFRNSQEEVSVATVSAHDCRDGTGVNDCRSAGKRGSTRKHKQLTTHIHRHISLPSVLVGF